LNPRPRPVAGVLALVCLAGGFAAAAYVILSYREGWEPLAAAYIAFFSVGVGAGLAAAAAAVALLRAERWMLLHAATLVAGLALALWIGWMFYDTP
jgi:hypothetical protein